MRPIGQANLRLELRRVNFPLLRFLHISSFFIAWDTARKKAGMPDVRIHDLCHSAASFLINSNHSLYVVQKLLGHTQIKTTARYSLLAPETMLNAVDTMANAAGLGVTPASVSPAPIASSPATPALRLVGKEEPAEAQGVEREAA
jgi:integrase